MTAQLLDGQLIAEQRKQTLKNHLQQLNERNLSMPCISVILVGHDDASLIYVNHKQLACTEVGIQSKTHFLPEDTSEQTLLEFIEQLNQNTDVDGILVQLPLPGHINPHVIASAIAINKDVDGLHPHNLGLLVRGEPQLQPCTPLGVIHLLQAYNIALHGQHVTIISASNIVGKPLAYMCIHEGATVTICHEHTQQIDKHISNADILISAIGQPDVIKTDWLAPKSTVVDIGICRDEERVRGDICFSEAIKKVHAITPVPGGIGPMTVVTLLENTFLAAQFNKKYPARI